MPNVGITGYVQEPAKDQLHYEDILGLSSLERESLDRGLIKDSNLHHLVAVGIAFWKPFACWKCHELLTPHAPIAKVASLYESLEVVKGISSTGNESVGLIKPMLEYQGQGQPMFLMPYAVQYMDKMLLNTWRETAAAAAELCNSPPAQLGYPFSKAFGGRYWALTCPACGSLQGEHFLKPQPLLSLEARSKAPMRGAPNLLILPTIDGQAVLGGKLFGRLILMAMN